MQTSYLQQLAQAADQKKKKYAWVRRLLVWGLALLFLGFLFVISQGRVSGQTSKSLLCFGALGACLFFGVLRFERERYGAATLVLLALLIAVAAVGRVVCAGIPSVQPTSFIVILCGLALGRRFGFMVGVGAAFWSNLFLGHGPWSLWQMLAWGTMGYVSGAGCRFLLAHRWALVGFGFIAGVLFGFGMNLWYVAVFFPQFSWGAFGAACASSIYLDIAHGLTNAVLLWWQKDRWYQLLLRAKEQYDI